MDKDGNIENKDQFSREEVSLIISRVRVKALIKVDENLKKQLETAKERSYDAMLNQDDKEKESLALQAVYGVKLLENIDDEIRDGLSKDIESYLTD